MLASAPAVAQAVPASITAAGIGPVRLTDTEATLAARIGSRQLVRADLPIGEGFCAPGSRVFPGTDRELEVVWSDSTRSRIVAVGARQPKSPWRTAAGVGVGTTLAELERIAGKAIVFSGFGWDYGGGAPWAEPGLEAGLDLFPDPASEQKVAGDPRYRETQGERSVSSDHPVIRAMIVRVDRIVVAGPARRESEFPCRR